MFAVHQCGLVIDPKYPFLGASPDGMVCCSCCGKGVLEIKCPFKYRDYSPTDDPALSDSNYCLKRSPNGTIHLSSKHKYYYQVQGQIALCNAVYCDFVCWTEKGLFIERIKRDEDLITTMLPQLKQFLLDYLLPELLTHNLQLASSNGDKTTNSSVATLSNERKTATHKSSVSASSDKEGSKKLYCICCKPESGQMIACDNVNCNSPDEWYHFKCVGLKRTPRGKWYCSHCRSSSS